MIRKERRGEGKDCLGGKGKEGEKKEKEKRKKVERDKEED